MNRWFFFNTCSVPHEPQNRELRDDVALNLFTRFIPFVLHSFRISFPRDFIPFALHSFLDFIPSLPHKQPTTDNSKEMNKDKGQYLGAGEGQEIFRHAPARVTNYERGLMDHHYSHENPREELNALSLKAPPGVDEDDLIPEKTENAPDTGMNVDHKAGLHGVHYGVDTSEVPQKHHHTDHHNELVGHRLMRKPLNSED